MGLTLLPADLVIVYGHMEMSMVKMMAAAPTMAVDVPALGWRTRTRATGLGEAKMVLEDLGASSPDRLNTTCIDVYMTDHVVTDGVIGLMDGANRRNPGDNLLLHETGAMTVMSSVNPLGVGHGDMVRAKGRAPRGSMIP